MAAPASGAAAAQTPRSVRIVSRKEKLENLLQREEMKDELLNKCRDRFSSRRKAPDERSLASEVVRREVDNFISSSAPMTEANIARLERRLQRKATGTDGQGIAEGIDAVSAFSISEYTIGSAVPSTGSYAKRSGPLTARIRQPTLGSSSDAPKGSLIARKPSNPSAVEIPAVPAVADAPVTGGAVPPGGLEWSVLDKLAAVMHKQDASRQKQLEQELKLRLQKDLDRQISDKRLRQDREKALDTGFLAQRAETLQRLAEEEEAHQELLKAKVQQTKRDREQQVQLLRMRREEQKRQELKEAKELTAAVSRDIQLERERTEKQQLSLRKQAKDSLVESLNDATQREAMRQKEIEREHKSAEEYQRQQTEREQLAKSATNKGRDQRQLADQTASQRAAADKALAEAVLSRAMAEQAKKDQHAAAVERANRERLANMRLQTQAFQLEQMQKKQQSMLEETQQRRQLRELQEREAKQNEEAEKQRQELRKMRNFAHRAELERQIASKAVQGQRKEVMSECELRLNKQLLERVTLALTDITSQAAS